MDKLVLVGNSNVGKTSIFNFLTKSSEHIGNWHGVTVEGKTKQVKRGDSVISLTDLPGLLSLTLGGGEEGAAREEIFKRDARYIYVGEVKSLSRNMYLLLELIELGLPLVFDINMYDEIGKGGAVDTEFLSKSLGIEVVTSSAKYRKNLCELIDLGKNARLPHKLPYLKNLPLEQVKAILEKECVGKNDFYKGLPKDFIAIKLLERDSFIAKYLEADERLLRMIASLGDYMSKIASLRYGYIDKLLETAVKKSTAKKAFSPDKFFLNKYLAFPIFLLIMAIIFLLAFGEIGEVPLPGKALSGLLEKGIELTFAPLVRILRERSYDWVAALFDEGIVKGAGTVLAFLPQITVLFLSLNVLEDTGYMPRVAYMTDGIFSRIGLSGKAVFTLLMGLGCSASAVITARNLDDKKLREKTVMVTPFMPCGARLPVLSAITAAYLGGSFLVIFTLYILGAICAVLFSLILNTRNKTQPEQILELPPFRVPSALRVFQLFASNIKSFFLRVATVIFALNIIVWVLCNFSFTFAYTGKGGVSMMETIASGIAPIFKITGFGDWRAVTALLSGLIAKEAVLASLSSLNVSFDSWVNAASFLVFVVLYTPCLAALSTMKKEIGIKKTLLAVLIELSAAYAASLIFYQLARLFV